MATRAEIEQAADLIATVTNNAMLAEVPLPDFMEWLTVLSARDFSARLRDNGRVHAHFSAKYRGSWIQVHTTADVLHGIALPPHDSGEIAPPIPAGQARLLELFGKAVA